ncbi:MAG: hypothetical protein HYR55_13885 [Acidobacteria bacterium]|nr:hypothetical protein [Acidobacteriota bacterium]MBI3655845.1 hypothetical protein [Acidobacteriota bacterium]
MDDHKGRKGRSRSQVIETLLREVQQKAQAEDLARQTQAFFAEEETAEERAERADWLRMSMETQAHDD